MQAQESLRQRSFASLIAAAIGVPTDEGADTSPLALLDEEAVPHHEPNLGEQYHAIWLQYGRALNEWKATLDLIRTDERAMLARLDRTICSSLDVLSEDAVDEKMVEAAKSIRSSLVRIAEKHFAPDGTTLAIDRSDVDEAVPFNRNDLSVFDPGALWVYLEATYGGDAGKKLAWQQVARAFKSRFGLDRQEEVVIKGGYVVLSVRVWIDDFDKKHYKKARLSISASERVVEVCNVLSEIATWADRHRLSNDVLALRGQISRWDNDIISRKQFPLGEGAEMVVVTYHNTFEYKFRQDFAEQLQIFLGLYGDDQ